MNKKNIYITMIAIISLITLLAYRPTSADNTPQRPCNIPFQKSLKLSADNNITFSKFSGFFDPLGKFIDIAVIDIDLKDKSLKIIPVQSDKTDTVKNLAEKENAIAAINGGFFDVVNGMSVSYVIINGKKVGDPSENHQLTSNPNIQPYLKAIYNRSELRILNCGGTLQYEINYRNRKGKKCEVVSSLQGGPMLVPELDLIKEGFVAYKDGKKVREAANVLNLDARVAVGITSDKHMIWIVNNAGYKDGKYYGLTIKELASLMSQFKVCSALAYDGGSSTTMYVNMPDGSSELIIGDVNKEGERIPARVKSILVLKED